MKDHVHNPGAGAALDPGWNLGSVAALLRLLATAALLRCAALAAACATLRLCHATAAAGVLLGCGPLARRTESPPLAHLPRRSLPACPAAGSTPLLIFPEGTCVNNEYCVMFKRGAFDLGGC
jgi:hypothetical protein